MYPALMLRREQRRRSGRPLVAEISPESRTPEHEAILSALPGDWSFADGATAEAKANAELDAWLLKLRETGHVVHYEADTDEGWFYVDRRPGVDLDIVREPDA